MRITSLEQSQGGGVGGGVGGCAVGSGYTVDGYGYPDNYSSPPGTQGQGVLESTIPAVDHDPDPDASSYHNDVVSSSNSSSSSSTYSHAVQSSPTAPAQFSSPPLLPILENEDGEGDECDPDDGIGLEEEENLLSIYPNPTNGLINLEYLNGDNNTVILKINLPL